MNYSEKKYNHVFDSVPKCIISMQWMNQRSWGKKKALWLDHWKSSLGKGNWIIIYMFFPLWPFSYIIVRFRIHGCDLVFYFQSAFVSLLAYRATCNIPLPQSIMRPSMFTFSVHVELMNTKFEEYVFNH